MTPLRTFLNWYKKAVARGDTLPEAVALASASKRGRPSVRFVLFKEIKGDSFIFFTNYRSTKAKDFSENPYAEVCAFWPKIYRQIRISGKVSKLSETESTAYWKTRPRESQIGAWASPQSHRISSHSELTKNFKAFEKKFKNVPVPRPPHWGGYSIKATRVEFWIGQKFRLHQREVFLKKNGRWVREILAP